jgi:hypothetical protein
MRDRELDELLGAFALDAVGDDERERIEAYLAINTEARAEADELRAAVWMLADEDRPAPPHIWDRIVAGLEGAPTRRSASPRSTGRRNRVVALVAAAAVVLAALGWIVTRASDDGGSEDAAAAIESAYEAARSDTDGRQVRLASADGRLVADAAITAEGLGYVSAQRLPELSAAETYQLWGVFADGDVISLGVFGNRPEIEPFTATGDLTALVITREVAGGVMASTSGALLSGEVGG